MPWDASGPAMPDEWVWAAVRAERNALLAASDWTQVADAPVDKVAWAAYRQALRDLPASLTDPRDATWPALPTSATVAEQEFVSGVVESHGVNVDVPLLTVEEVAPSADA